MRHILIALFVAVGITLVAPRALAEDREIQVLAIASQDAWENGKALTGALRRAVLRADGWTLASGEYSLEVLSAALDCPEPPDNACLNRIAEQVGAKRVLWGEVEKKSNREVTAHLRLWHQGRNKTETTFTYSANLTDDTDDALLALAVDALAELIGRARGTLIIAAGDVDGEVLVDGVPVGLVKKGQAQVDVPSGKLAVLVEAPGYENLLGTVVVPPGGNAILRLDPVPVEGAEPKEVEVDQKEPEPATGNRKVWAYASLGLGGAAALTGAVFWAVSYNQAHDEAFERYVNETPRDQDPCERAHDEGANNITDICDSNLTSRYLAFSMFGLGAVLGGVGAYLLLTDDTGSEETGGTQARAVQVRPLVGIGPQAGRLDLQVRF